MAPGNPSAAHSMDKRKLVSSMYFSPLPVIFLLTFHRIYNTTGNLTPNII
jgi:hypothetical protein